MRFKLAISKNGHSGIWDSRTGVFYPFGLNVVINQLKEANADAGNFLDVGFEGWTEKTIKFCTNENTI